MTNVLYLQEGESDAHHVTAADGLAFLPPRETCSLAPVTVEAEQMGYPDVPI